MTDAGIYMEAEEKATKYEELHVQLPLSLHHTRLIYRLNKLLCVLKKQLFNELDVDVLIEVYNLANDEIKKATNKDLDAFIRIAHEAKLLLIEHHSL